MTTVVVRENVVKVVRARGPKGDAGAAGTTDHGALTGLADDDHTQYFNQSRFDTAFALKASTSLSDTANIIYKTQDNTFDDGTRQTFNPDATKAGLNVGAHTAAPSSPIDGDVYLNSTSNQMFGRVNGAWVDLGAGSSGGDAWSDPVDAVITPDADGTRDLATTLVRFATGYFDNINITTNITVGGTVDGRDIAADGTKLDGIEANADVTDATNVDAAGAVMESDYNANTILAATSDNTPVPLTVAEQTLVGRITAGNIDALTATEVRTLINVEDGATADQTQEEIQDAAWAAASGGTQTGITVTYQDSTNDVDFIVGGLTTTEFASTAISQWTNDAGYITATLTNEQVQDIVGVMVTGNTETLITVTYQDADGTIDFVVDNDLANYSNATTNFISDITAESVGDLSDVTITTLGTDELLFTQDGSTFINQTLAEAGISAVGHTHAASDITSGTFADARIAQSNVTQHEAAINHDALLNFVANEHIDWTSTTSNLSTSGTAATGNLTVTGTISVTSTVDGRDIAADGTKLDGIESGATADQTDEEIQDAAWNVLTGTQTGITVTYQDGTNDVDFVVDSASTSQAGIIESAIASEVNTGTSTTLAVTPDALAGSYAGTKEVQLQLSSLLSLTTGDGKRYFTVPSSFDGMNLVAVHAEVNTAGTTGTTDIQIHNVTQAADMLSTKITIDSAETGSDTAATAAVIDTANDDVASYDVLRIDIDAVSTTAPKGLMITMQFRLP